PRSSRRPSRSGLSSAFGGGFRLPCRASRRSFIVRGASLGRGAGWGVLSGAVSGPIVGAPGWLDVLRRFGTAVSVIGRVPARGGSQRTAAGRFRAPPRPCSFRLHLVPAELVAERREHLGAVGVVLA